MTYHRTTEEEKRLISGWKYDGEYAIYNLPPYEEQLQKHRGFANPMNSFYSFVENETLVGYVNLIGEENGVFFGIGVRPGLCGRGWGQRITRCAIALSHRLYPGKPLYLEVRTWNLRAVRCYEKAGFRIDGAPFTRTTPIGEGVFYRMVSP